MNSNSNNDNPTGSVTVNGYYAVMISVGIMLIILGLFSLSSGHYALRAQVIANQTELRQLRKEHNELENVFLLSIIGKKPQEGKK